MQQTPTERKQNRSVRSVIIKCTVPVLWWITPNSNKNSLLCFLATFDCFFFFSKEKYITLRIETVMLSFNTNHSFLGFFWAAPAIQVSLKCHVYLVVVWWHSGLPLLFCISRGTMTQDLPLQSAPLDQIQIACITTATKTKMLMIKWIIKNIKGAMA